MTTGNYNKIKLVFERKQGEGIFTDAELPNVKVYKSGPFFECYINDVIVGKVMKYSKCMVHPKVTKPIGECEECSGYCLKLKEHIIVLSVSEHIDITYEISADRDRREKGKDEKIAASVLSAIRTK